MTKLEVLTNMVDLHSYIYNKVLKWDYDNRLNEIDIIYSEVYNSWEYKKVDEETILDIN